MRGIGLILICLLLSLSFSGCALRPKRPVGEDPRTKAEDQFDPLGFPQDQEIVTEKEPPVKPEGSIQPEDDSRIRLRGPEEADSLSSIKVYRVQFFATKYPDEATQVSEMVAEQLSERTYVEYKAPYYWVRVGDCETKDESDALLRTIKNMGYRQSWVIEVELEP